MRNQESLLLKTYLNYKDSTPELRTVLQPHFLLNAILFVPLFLIGLLIFFVGVREGAFMVLGIWLGLFLCDIRHGKTFVKLWPIINEYLNWEKIERKLNEDEKS